MVKKRARRRYWIDRQIQGALATRILLHWLIFGVIAAVLTIAMQILSNPFGTFADHADTLWNNQGPFAIVMFVLLPIFIYDTIRLSNRFAGPVLRLRRVMTAIAEGKPAERVVFRDNDFWAGMAKDFNELIDRGYFDEPRERQPAPEEKELQEVS